jgi:hypothetical protein
VRFVAGADGDGAGVEVGGAVVGEGAVLGRVLAEGDGAVVGSAVACGPRSTRSCGELAPSREEKSIPFALVGSTTSDASPDVGSCARTSSSSHAPDATAPPPLVAVPVGGGRDAQVSAVSLQVFAVAWTTGPPLVGSITQSRRTARVIGAVDEPSRNRR